MIFSELYSAYYQTVAVILRQACTHPISRSDLRKTVEQYAFGESVLNIEPALLEERWQLLRPDGTTPVQHVPTMPLTLLQKRWLNAIALDPRIRLFCDQPTVFPDVEPLFTPDDVRIFDRYLDGDPYEDEAYIRNFRLVLDAVRTRTPLQIDMVNRKGSTVHRHVLPEYLEYSEKDDKFRLVSPGCRHGSIINLARIVRCTPYPGTFTPAGGTAAAESRTVELEVYNERNALERMLMHFAHFEKQAEKIDETRFRVSITYSSEDETELVIRILSFGPMVKVISPDAFTAQIRDRLIRQKSCGQ